MNLYQQTSCLVAYYFTTFTVRWYQYERSSSITNSSSSVDRQKHRALLGLWDSPPEAQSLVNHSLIYCTMCDDSCFRVGGSRSCSHRVGGERWESRSRRRHSRGSARRGAGRQGEEHGSVGQALCGGFVVSLPMYFRIPDLLDSR